MVLLINKNNDAKFAPYSMQYRLFNDWKTAVEAAKEIGWQDPFGMGVDKKIGMANNFQCGDINVTMIALEPQ